MTRIQFPAGVGIFLFITVFRLALGPTQPIQWVTGALFLGVKKLGHETAHLSPTSAKAKNGVIPPLPDTSSWHGP